MSAALAAYRAGRTGLAGARVLSGVTSHSDLQRSGTRPRSVAADLTQQLPGPPNQHNRDDQDD